MSAEQVFSGPLSADHRCISPGELSQSAIEDFHIAIAPHHDVLWLDIAVRDPGRMGRLKRVGDLNGDIKCVTQINAGFGHELPQCLAINEFSDNEVCTIQTFNFMNSDDIRMIKRCDCSRLVFEPAHALRTDRELSGQQLNCDFACELCVLGQVDLSHSSLAEEIKNLISIQHRS